MIKKVWLILLAVALVACFFVACSDDGGASQTPTPSPGPGPGPVGPGGDTWTVTFDKNGGDTEADPTSKTVVSPATTIDSLPTPPTKEGYRFVKWTTESNGSGTDFTATTPVTGSITVYAQWREKIDGEMVVTFDKNGGDTEANPDQIDVISPATNVGTLPTPPSRYGYTFAGWNTEDDGSGTEFTATTTVDDDITVYAQWTPVSFTITCDKNGGDTEANPKVITVTFPNNTIANQQFTRPDRAGYVFKEWNTDPDGNGTVWDRDTVVTENIIVYAIWTKIEANSLIVTFDGNGGEVPPMPNQKVVTPPATTIDALPTAPGRTDYVFKEWNTEQDGSGTEFTATTTVTATITVYAQWIAGFTVTFNPNGGTPNTNQIKKVTSPATTVDALPTPPTRDNYVFAGWFTVNTATGGTEFTASTTVEDDIIVYARWTAVPLVNFDKNNSDSTGTTEASPHEKYASVSGTVGTLPAPPTRSDGWGAGMVFDGWNTESDGSGTAFTASTSVTNNITVYAQWRFENGTAQVAGNTLVHIAPALTQSTGTAQGEWNGSGLDATDGSYTYSGGAIRYAFPASVGDYDFFTVSYIATKPANESNPFKVIPKQFDTGDAYKTKAGVEFVDLNNGTGTLDFIVSQATKNGIAFQFNSYGGNSSVGTIKITKITFTKGVRHTLTFDSDGGNAISPMTIVETVPFTLPVPIKNGFNFSGWQDNGGTIITSASTINTDLSLTAQWTAQSAQPQTVTVDFTTANPTLCGNSLNDTTKPTLTNITSSGYTLTWGNNNGYGGTWVKFNVTLTPGVTLGQYKTVTFTLQAVQGDTNFKDVRVLGDTTLPATSQAAPTNTIITTETSKQFTNGTNDMSFTVNPGSTLTGTIQVCIYIPCGNGTSPNWTQFNVSNVKFNP